MIPKNLDFNDYDNYPADENPTTNAQMQEFMRNQNALMQQLSSMVWQPNTSYETGHVIRSSSMPSGLQAIVTTAGVTGNDEPQWEEADKYLQDGGVIYVMRQQFNGNALTEFMANLIFPVGKIEILTVSTNPHDLYGIGEWERIGEGRTIIDCGNTYKAGTTGGNADAIVPYHTHTFTGKSVNTGNQSASHTHSGTTSSNGSHSHKIRDSGGHGGGTAGAVDTSSETTSNWYGNIIESAGAHTHTITTGNQSASHTHAVVASGTNSYAGTNGNTTKANMPPYLAVYIWKRVS